MSDETTNSSRWASLLGVCILSACQSVGMQYRQPKNGEPYATLNGGGYYINNADCNGRYAGRTHIDGPKYEVHANQPISITIEGPMRGDDFCRASVAIIPEANRAYSVKANFTKIMVREFPIPVSRGACSLGISQIEPNGAIVHTPVVPWGTGKTDASCSKNQ